MILSLTKTYLDWLHLKWPTASVEKLPKVNAHGETCVRGAYIVGDLLGKALLKFSSDSGAACVSHVAENAAFLNRKIQDGVQDLVIIGGGVSGHAAAAESTVRGLSYTLFEANHRFSTIQNFPESKPIYLYPDEMKVQGALDFESEPNTKEALLDYLNGRSDDQAIRCTQGSISHFEKTGAIFLLYSEGRVVAKAHRVIIAIGRSGNYRELDIPGAQSDKVLNRLHDPKVYRDHPVMVVGGGDSALETAILCAEAGVSTTLSYRQSSFSKAKAENIEKVERLAGNGQLTLLMSSELREIRPDSVDIIVDGEQQTMQNDIVFTMLGREPPTEFFRKCKIRLYGDNTVIGWGATAFFVVLMTLVYDWKSHYFFESFWSEFDYPGPFSLWVSELGDWWDEQVWDRSTVVGTLVVSMSSRSFYYTLLYSLIIAFFGLKRILKHRTPYIRNQTISLTLVQFIPLFLLPEFLLPWWGYNGHFSEGIGKTIADSLFPSYISEEQMLYEEWPEGRHPRAYSHAYGFILAWPLYVYNVFTSSPMMGWLIISCLQTFVIIPYIVYRWGKGAYCGWICSCGALAETLGDAHRHKMPKGRIPNRLNIAGQVILLIAMVMFVARVYGWIFPESWVNQYYDLLLYGRNAEGEFVNPLSWVWTVDALFAGIIGLGFYFKYSGRVWCRFFCPLAALMHIYARFSRFRIFSKKEKCISCNECTKICHQGIDVMNFANKGEPMADPQCVRCSACVTVCPTQVLSFGAIDSKAIKVKQL